jgi:hypothetical protein
MMRSILFLLSSALLAISASAAPGDGSGLIYLATWPHQILVFDTSQEKIIDHIDLTSDIAQQLVLSADKKRLYGYTVKDNSIVTVDLSTRKQVSVFPLNEPNRSVRLLGLAPDPTGKFLYSVGASVIKRSDHYDIEPTKLMVIDLEDHKISRFVDFPKDESLVGFWRIQMKFSPDAKYFYMFLGSVLVFDSQSLQLVKKIDLADPHVPGIANVIFNPVEEEPAEDPNEEPGKLTNVFMSTDPYVHRAVFGIAKIDLANLSFDFTAIAPATTLSMTPLLYTPDHSVGYTVAINGTPGNRRCEFWAFDMKTRKLINKKEFEGRNRFSFGLSADGTKILIYGAGYEIDVYDAKTFEFRRNIPLPGDMTSNIIVMPGSAAMARLASSATNSAAVH